MAISHKTLTEEIRRKFPRINKPQDYANLILKGIELKTYDSSSAKRRSKFLESKKIKEYVFTRSYVSLKLLNVIKGADTNTAISSNRAGLIFSLSYGKKIVEYEQKLLLEHVSLDSHVRITVIRSLNLSPKANFNMIRNSLKQGYLYKQVSTYKKVYDNLGKNGIMPRGYRSLSVVTTPVSHYYLSNITKNIIERCKRR